MVKWGIAGKQRPMSDARGEGFVSRRSRQETGWQIKFPTFTLVWGRTSGVARVKD